ncbi:MAG: sensor histidine kinase [Deltaproteobacteria bacterium]
MRLRMTLTAKLGLAFALLAMVAGLPGLLLLGGIARLRRQTRRSLAELASRDACQHARATAVAASAALRSHALFPRDSRFGDAARAGVAAADAAVRAALLGLTPAESSSLQADATGLDGAAAAFLGAPTIGPPPSAEPAKAAADALIAHLDRLVQDDNESLAKHGQLVASTVDRLAIVGEAGLVATGLAALALSLVLGRAWARRMAAIRVGAERVATGDLHVRIDDRESDEVGTLARSFNRMVGELQILEEMKSQFVAVASHELRTPLTLIDGYCGILLNPAKGPLSEWHQQRIELIHGQVVELLSLLQDLLDAERLQTRALAPVLEPIDPESWASGLVGSFDGLAKGKEVALRLTVAPSTPRSGLADVRALTRVLRNLVDNALKYTEAGEVEISLAGHAGELTMSVRDTGLGIPEEDLSRIFGRFYQVNDGRPRRGFGLGLSIVRGLVERNGGTVKVDSRVGSGSTFHVAWPLRLEPLARSEAS